MTKISSAIDRLANSLAAEGISLPRNKLRNILADVAGCRNDNEYVKRSDDLYPRVERVQTVYHSYDVPLHVLQDPRTRRRYAVDSQALEQGQSKAGLLQPCPYGGMVDVESALLAPDQPLPLTEEERSMPAYRFRITRATTESAEVVVRAPDIKTAHDKATGREFSCDPRRARFLPDDDNYPDLPYIPDPDDYEVEEENAA